MRKNKNLAAYAIRNAELEEQLTANIDALEKAAQAIQMGLDVHEQLRTQLAALKAENANLRSNIDVLKDEICRLSEET